MKRNGAFLGLFSLLFFLSIPSVGKSEKGLPPMVEKNPFSEERKYDPSFSQTSAKGLPKENLLKGLILRGTFRSGNIKLAVLEIQPYLHKKFDISENKTIFREGERLGPCILEKISKGRIILGGECEGYELKLADAPERKKSITAQETKKTTMVKNRKIEAAKKESSTGKKSNSATKENKKETGTQPNRKDTSVKSRKLRNFFMELRKRAGSTGSSSSADNPFELFRKSN